MQTKFKKYINHDGNLIVKPNIWEFSDWLNLKENSLKILENRIGKKLSQEETDLCTQYFHIGLKEYIKKEEGSN
jgi:hypothetical protein